MKRSKSSGENPRVVIWAGVPAIDSFCRWEIQQKIIYNFRKGVERDIDKMTGIGVCKKSAEMFTLDLCGL